MREDFGTRKPSIGFMSIPPDPSRPPSDGAHAVFEVLADWGVDLLFTCPGSTEAAVLDASLEYPGCHTILTTHESIAVAAADGYARASGKPAVAYLHANVGLANGIAHLACASLTNSPVVVLNGMKSTEILNRGGFTTSPFQQDAVRQYVRSSRVVARAEEVAGDLSRALKVATAAPGGPVFLGLPQDLVETPTATPIPSASDHRVAARRRPDPEAVAAAAARLSSARAVAIVAGRECASPGAYAAVVALADYLGSPLLLEDRRSIAQAAIPGNHPLFCGSYTITNPAVASAEVVLVVGMSSFMEFEALREPQIPAGAQLIHIAADPEEIGKTQPTAFGLAGDAEWSLRDLFAALPPDDGIASAARRAHAGAAIDAYRSATLAARSARRARYGEQPIHPEVLMEALHETLPSDCILVNDAVTSGGYMNDVLLPDSARSMFTTTGGSLGWGMGAAIGIQLARPQARVVTIVGDGVFQFGIQAFATAVALRLPLVFIVVDNASYAAVRAAMKRYRARTGQGHPGVYPASDLAGPDLAAIASGFGAHAQTITHLNELPNAIATALAHNGPSVVVVKTDTEHTGP